MASLALQSPALRSARLPAPLAATGRRRSRAANVPLRYRRCLAAMQPVAPGAAPDSNPPGSSIKVSLRGVRLQIRGWVRDWGWGDVLLKVLAVADIVVLFPMMRLFLLTRLIWYGFAVLALLVVFSR